MCAHSHSCEQKENEHTPDIYIYIYMYTRIHMNKYIYIYVVDSIESMIIYYGYIIMRIYNDASETIEKIINVMGECNNKSRKK